MDSRRDVQTYAIIGAAMEVHNTLGHGFLENVYSEALSVELTTLSIPFKREYPISIVYKGTTLSCQYKADLICFGTILVELKALSRLSSAEDAQTLNYLKASGLNKGLLINFGSPKLEYKRFIL